MEWMGKSRIALRHPYGFIVLATTCLFVLIGAHISLNQGSAIKPYRLERLQPQDLARNAFSSDGSTVCTTPQRLHTFCDMRKGNFEIDGFQSALLRKPATYGTKTPKGRYEQGIPTSPYSVLKVPRGPPEEIS